MTRVSGWRNLGLEPNPPSMEMLHGGNGLAAVEHYKSDFKLMNLASRSQLTGMAILRIYHCDWTR